MGNVLKLQLKHASLSVDVGEGDVDAVAEAIETAITTEITQELQASSEAHTAQITQLQAENGEARGVLADEIIRLKTLSGAIKADDEAAIKSERAYLLGAEGNDADHGLPTSRLVAEFKRAMEAAPAASTEAATQGGNTQQPTEATQNPFLPTAAPVGVQQQQTAVRPA